MWLWLAPLIAYLLVGAALVVKVVWDDRHAWRWHHEPLWWLALLFVGWLPMIGWKALRS